MTSMIQSSPIQSGPIQSGPIQSGPIQSGGLRLTRRGRVVVVAAALLGVAAGATLRSAPAASTDEVHHQRTATVVVRPGDTVWRIAEQVRPGVDPRSVVAEIERLNHLTDAGSVQVGQPLLVPVG